MAYIHARSVNETRLNGSLVNMKNENNKRFSLLMMMIETFLILSKSLISCLLSYFLYIYVTHFYINDVVEFLTI